MKNFKEQKYGWGFKGSIMDFVNFLRNSLNKSSMDIYPIEGVEGSCPGLYLGFNNCEIELYPDYTYRISTKSEDKTLLDWPNQHPRNLIDQLKVSISQYKYQINSFKNCQNLGENNISKVVSTIEGLIKKTEKTILELKQIDY